MITLIPKDDYIELKESISKRIVLRAYKSPVASWEQNMWLARKLRSIYRKYYMKVSLDNCLDFFNESGERRA